jgi:hypothetical protein
MFDFSRNLKRRIFASATCFLFCFCLFATSVRAEVVATYKAGFLELIEGKKVIHVKGTASEMGEQYGALLRDDLIAMMKQLEAYAMSFKVPRAAIPEIRWIGSNLFKRYIPEEDMEYMKGIVKGVNDEKRFRLNDVIVFNVLIDAGGTVSDMFETQNVRLDCSSIAVWGSLTKEGKLYQTRNVDLEIGTGLENYTLVAMNKPTGKTPYVNIGWTGLIGVASGLSAKGLGIGQIWGSSTDYGLGTPWPFKTRKFLAEANSADEAARWMKEMPDRTYGSNFVFGDGLNLQGRAVETTHTLAAIFRDDDPAEDLALFNGEPYAIKIPEAVFRADQANDPAIRQFQIAANGPDGDPRTSSSYKNRYKGQSDRVLAYRDQGIAIGPEELMTLSREVAMRNCNLQCVVYSNTDREFWVANAIIDQTGTAQDAWTQPFFHYSLNEYLPTMVALPLSKSSYKVGESVTVAYRLENFGTSRDMQLSFVLKTKDKSYNLPDFSSEPQVTWQSFPAWETGQYTLKTSALPSNLTKGAATLEARLVDPSSGKLVDLAVSSFRIQ